ncbi:xylulose kinase [Bifidobacterium actinocoloniiforme DSM 22766]|uniref:Xylulose kinase n=1 Tax=Bifidobacterium actinocoloniiforme DSM 22766 TaxID=1437605 RepID=A0A086Z102_9BIFI|nr:FGGY family carbohydrate kinase [Bifidobacterium actinocoloniiforme]AKV55383.1 xylulose kinase [Bifidobacterium actinocoloniiforme DSM 22766]KFI40202.1 xylulose kinase [Bifidobacterium actinocoloniiforme DSM 22766]
MGRILVAGVDTSTQSCKVRVSDAATGEQVRFGQARHPEGTSVNPEAWWCAFQQAATQAGGLDDVSALSVGGQQHGMVLLDERGQVLRDALLWNDTRSAPQARVLIEQVGQAPIDFNNPTEADFSPDPIQRGQQRWVKAVGSSPVASLTITKLAWVTQHEPEAAGRIAAICLPHDWLSWRIAGHGPASAQPSAGVGLDALCTDRSDASGTGYFDSVSDSYRRDILALALPAELAQGVLLPRVLGPHETACLADPAIAGRNVPGGCIIAPGGGDNAMASLGLSMEVGDVSISLGTSGVAAAISPVPAYDMSAAVTGFADATGHWLPLACTINGSRILDAGCAALGVDYEGLANLASQSTPGADGITLVPYFDGERTPNLPDATASLRGMTMANTTRENLARAFVEGLLCSQRDCLELLKRLGTSVKRILLIGGGAQSPAVRAYAPQILGQSVLLPQPDQYVAIGAARQAAWALSDSPQPPAWPVRIESTLTAAPTPTVYAQYTHCRG